MAKDKNKEAEYKAEGLRRMKLRKEKRNVPHKIKKSYLYSNDGYGCPTCGLSSLNCTTTAWHSYICPKCKKEFETPET